jgi:hypothetical protein
LGCALGAAITWLAELFPRGEKFAVPIEDGDAAVAAVGDEEAPLRIERDHMGALELAVARTQMAEGRDELSVLVELHDARIAEARRMPFGHEDIAVGRDRH